MYRLDWDSKFFDFEIWSSNYNEFLLVERPKEKINLIYLRSPNRLDSAEIKNIEIKWKAIVTYEDEKLDFKKIISNPSKLDIDYKIDSALDQPLSSEIIDLGIESGSFSRFKMDSKIGFDYKSLYIKWVENSYLGELADHFLVAVIDSNPVGLITAKKIDDCMRIGIISISERYRGKKIASALLSHIETIASDQKIRKVHVSTQGINEGAVKLYKKNGYELSEKQFLYHILLIDDSI